MIKAKKVIFCELPETPHGFDLEKFKAGDPDQKRLYNMSKAPRRKKTLTYDQVTSEPYPNYARVVPEDCVFIDFDNASEAAEMREIILMAKLKCLMLETTHGYHFLFRKPDFYDKEMTGATNWFGYKFDCKATTEDKEAVQIMRVCDMDRKEITSWDGKEVMLEELDIDKLDVLPYWLWGKLSDKDLHKEGKTRKK